ncbi:Sirtuin 2 (silent mating type information regulation 2) 2-like [Scleropages formosus]|uniref:NAD-dependent protein deacetylase sirtuin-2 n=1 Tax=Scleropages formosus TaxID=113540 RepID=A0A0P7U6R6_SCLFO|nr:Sirtuin 2 (silent mating type information regulation 2) 2-like [Scleropages formosus]
MSDAPEPPREKEEDSNLCDREEEPSEDSSEEDEASGETEMDFLRSLFSRTLGLGSGEKVLDELTLDGVARYILSGKCKFHSTVGIILLPSAAGIPDFRSPGTGLYANLQKYSLPYPEAIFQIDYFKKHPEPFFALAKELYPGQFKPTICHYFIRMLKDKGLLRRCYSQNIDTLERVAGLEEDDLVEAHGTFYTSHCVSFLCRKEYNLDWMKARIFSDEVPKCEKCSSLVKPDIVFFGENLPAKFFTSTTTSDALMGMLGFGGGMDFDSEKAYRDVAYISTCDEGCMALAEFLGWKAELEDLVKREHALIDSKDKQDKAKLANQTVKAEEKTATETGNSDKLE